MSKSIGFIGIGNMGGPMASKLIKAGKKVRVYDISKDALEKAEEKKFNIANSINDLLKDLPSAIITMLPAGEHSKEVYLGKEGIISKVSKDCLLIDCSTIDIKTSIEIGTKAKQLGIKMIDAPVSGGVMGAENGNLTFLVGGSKDAFNLAKPLLEIMGKNIFHAGELGCGNGAKICNNLALGISMIGSSEALMLAKRLNIDIKKVHEIMKNASGNSWPISVYPPLPGLKEGVPSNNKYRPGFSAGMMSKDLKLAIECAEEVKANTPLGSTANDIYDKFCKEGYYNKDFSAISKVVGGDSWDYEIDD